MNSLRNEGRDPPHPSSFSAHPLVSWLWVVESVFPSDLLVSRLSFLFPFLRLFFSSFSVFLQSAQFLFPTGRSFRTLATTAVAATAENKHENDSKYGHEGDGHDLQVDFASPNSGLSVFAFFRSVEDVCREEGPAFVVCIAEEALPLRRFDASVAVFVRISGVVDGVGALLFNWRRIRGRRRGRRRRVRKGRRVWWRRGKSRRRETRRRGKSKYEKTHRHRRADIVHGSAS